MLLHRVLWLRIRVRLLLWRLLAGRALKRPARWTVEWLAPPGDQIERAFRYRASAVGPGLFHLCRLQTNDNAEIRVDSAFRDCR